MKFIFVFLWLSIAFSKRANSKRSLQFKFSGGERKSHAKLLGTITHELTDFTLCHWSKTNRPVSGSHFEVIFNYMLPEKPLAILTSIKHNKLVHVYGDSKHVESNISKLGNEWIHICFIWSVTDSTSETFIDGQLVSNRSNPTISSPIKPNGLVQLGVHGTDIDRLTGQISELNLWDRALQPEEVKQIYNCENQPEGNLISWYDSTWELFDGTTVSHVKLPCGGP